MANYPKRLYRNTVQYGEDLERISGRESYVLVYETGSIEGWRTALDSYTEDGEIDLLKLPQYVGGIEVHSSKPLYEGQEPMPTVCEYVKGGTCYHDGSSLAFDQIEPYFERSARTLYSILENWRGRLDEPNG